jgi:hypothetical protein
MISPRSPGRLRDFFHKVGQKETRPEVELAAH